MTQDNIIKGIEETLSNMPAQTLDPMTPDIISPVEEEKLSFELLLTHYVDLELEQTRLVNTMHMTRLKDPKAGRELSIQALAHSAHIKTFALEAIAHPEIKAELEKLKNVRPLPLAQRGGFIGIREKISKGEWLREDIHAILVRLRGKAQDQLRSRTQERDRGGRSR